LPQYSIFDLNNVFCQKVDKDIAVFSNKTLGIAGVFWNEFDTHLKCQGGYKKINGQLIYGSTNHFTRASLMKNLKDVLFPSVIALKNTLVKNQIQLHRQSNRLTIIFGVPIEYGSVKMLKGKNREKRISFSQNGNCNWDLDNQWIWRKAFLDACQQHGVLKNDTADIIGACGEQWVKVPSFEDRYIGFIFSEKNLHLVV